MSTWYRAPEIKFLQAQGKLNGTLDPWSDSESDDESFTSETPEMEGTEVKGEMGEEEKAFIRPYEEKDREAVTHVCLETASDTMRNVMSPPPTKAGEVKPEHLAAHMWAHPYLTLSPSYCFVLCAKNGDDEKVVGYILSTPDTFKFVERIDSEYIPAQASTRPWLHKDWKPPKTEDEEDRLLTLLHYPGESMISHRYPSLIAAYPAHLHINILPSHAGQGYGRQLQETLWAKLRAERIPGVHLECANDNANAIAFYKHMGFEEWDKVMDGGKSGGKGVYREMIKHGSVEITGQVMVKKL